MRIFISMFMVLALVMTTSLPATSYAMIEKYEASLEHGDCHKQAKVEQFDKTVQNDKEFDKCCDKGMCKCVGSACHNGLSKIFNNGNGSLFPLASNKAVFSFTNDVVESALLSCLKRPPKA